MQFGVHEKPVHSGGYMTRQQCITKGHDGGIWSLAKWMAKNTWNFYAFITFLENLSLIRRFWKWTLCDITRWTNQEAVNRGLSELWSPRRKEHQGGTSNVDPLIGLQQCVGKWEKENQSLHKLRSWGSREANWNSWYEPPTGGRLFHESEEDTWSQNQLWPRERDGQLMWGGRGTAGLFPHHAMWGNTIKPQPLRNGRGRDSDGGAAAGASEETKGAAESKETWRGRIPSALTSAPETRNGL